MALTQVEIGENLDLLLNDGEVLHWLGSPGKWERIGNDGRIVSMAADGNALYLLLRDGEVLRWLGSPDKWERIGNDGRIVSMTADGNALYLLLKDGEVLRWLGSPDKWEPIGNDGRIVSMTVGSSFSLPAPDSPPDPDQLHFDSGRVNSNLPLNGNAQLLLKRDGPFTLTGHVHGSGADPIDYGMVITLATATGDAFQVHHEGNVPGKSSQTPSTPIRTTTFSVQGTWWESLSVGMRLSPVAESWVH